MMDEEGARNQSWFHIIDHWQLFTSGTKQCYMLRLVKSANQAGMVQLKHNATAMKASRASKKQLRTLKKETLDDKNPA